jgi:hypothetical protein
MSNVIQFLESMGKDAMLGKLSLEDFSVAVKALDVDDAAKHALLNRDQNALNDSIGSYKKMMMLLLPAEDDDQGEEKKKDDDKDHEQAPKEPPVAN